MPDSPLKPRLVARAQLTQKSAGAGSGQGGLTLARQHQDVGVRVLLASALQGRPGVGDLFAPAPSGVDYVGAIDSAWNT